MQMPSKKTLEHWIQLDRLEDLLLITQSAAGLQLPMAVTNWRVPVDSAYPPAGGQPPTFPFTVAAQRW